MGVFIAKTESDTEVFAKELAKALSYGVSVGLRGDLGAGKTTLVRYVVEALNGPSAQVASPSFALQYEYVVSKDRKIEHWDLYRLRETPDDLQEPPESDTVRLIEWPDKASGLIDGLDLLIEISSEEGGTRKISYTGPISGKLESLFLS